MQPPDANSHDAKYSQGTIVFIGLGSSLGNRRRYLQRAIAKIAHHSDIVLLDQSSVWSSVPIGSAKHIFLNMVIRIRSQLSPEELLRFLQSIETQCGRKRGVHWMDRVVDLDILFYGDLCVQNQFLTIPHPRILERNFVLLPLKEIQHKISVSQMPISSVLQEDTTRGPWAFLKENAISTTGIWKSVRDHKQP
jgi:2-amino-4-hydroxy-6-hydroxymethyldihydropteridine diphosphokinase